jgi:hypothetical protein
VNHTHDRLQLERDRHDDTCPAIVASWGAPELVIVSRYVEGWCVRRRGPCGGYADRDEAFAATRRGTTSDTHRIC